MQSSKNTKKQNASFNNKKTLDIQHSTKLSEFMESSKSVQDLKDRVSYLDNKLNTFKETQRKGHEYSDLEINEMLQWKDERDSLLKRIDELIEQDEVDYYVNAAPILFQYYDIIEKGNDDTQISSMKENSILKFFVQPKKETSDLPTEENKTCDRASLLDKYLYLTDDNYVKTLDPNLKDRCIHCGSTDKVLLVNDGLIHCNNCDCIEYAIIDHDRPSYKEHKREISYFSYKRINHLNEFKCVLKKILMTITIIFWSKYFSYKRHVIC